MKKYSELPGKANELKLHATMSHVSTTGKLLEQKISDRPERYGEYKGLYYFSFNYPVKVQYGDGHEDLALRLSYAGTKPALEEFQAWLNS